MNLSEQKSDDALQDIRQRIERLKDVNKHVGFDSPGTASDVMALVDFVEQQMPEFTRDKLAQLDQLFRVEERVSRAKLYAEGCSLVPENFQVARRCQLLGIFMLRDLLGALLGIPDSVKDFDRLLHTTFTHEVLSNMGAMESPVVRECLARMDKYTAVHAAGYALWVAEREKLID